MAQEMPAHFELRAFVRGAPNGQFLVVADGCNSRSGYQTRLEPQNSTAGPQWAVLYNEASTTGATVMTPFCCELAMDWDDNQSAVTVLLPDGSARQVTIMRSGRRCGSSD